MSEVIIMNRVIANAVGITMAIFFGASAFIDIFWFVTDLIQR
jgi:hypothetical protein